MSTILSFCLFALIALVLVAAGACVMAWVDRDSIERLTRELAMARLHRDEWMAAARRADEDANRAIALADRAMVTIERFVKPRASKMPVGKNLTETTTVVPVNEGKVEDPPTTREADRRIVAARRASLERELTSDDRMAVRVSGEPDVMPAPQLRDADDDH